MPDHRPFVLIADLEGPISLNRPLHVDGILYDVLFKRGGEVDFSATLHCVTHRAGIPCSSAGLVVYESLGGVTRTTMKRLRGIRLSREGDIIAYDPGPRGHRTRAISDMSEYRMQMPSYPLLFGATQIWWQILGDPDAVLDLASDVAGLGRLRQHGYGTVRRWHITDCAADPRLAGHITGNGQIIRRLPVKAFTDVFKMPIPDGLPVDHGRPVAPYWSEDGATEIVEPDLDDLIMHVDRAEMVLEVIT